MFASFLLKKPLVRGVFGATVCSVFLVAATVEAKVNFPFEKFSKYKNYNEVDTIVSRKLQAKNIAELIYKSAKIELI